jgi:hypothetical protein
MSLKLSLFVNETLLSIVISKNILSLKLTCYNILTDPFL